MNELIGNDFKSNASASLDPVVVAAGKEIISSVISGITDYAKCTQEQETERLKIRAQLKVDLAKIHAQKELYSLIINKHYDERNRLYDMLYEGVELAKANNDMETFKYILNAIIVIYKERNIPMINE